MKYRIVVVNCITTDYKDVDSCFDGLIEQIDKAESQGYKLKDVLLGSYILEKGKDKINITVTKPVKELK